MLKRHDQADNSGQASLAEWVDQVADRFDAAWQGGSPPRIADFLGEATGERRSALLAELVKIDLEYRWRAGTRANVEDYVSTFPELRQPDGSIADELVVHAARVQRQFGAAREGGENRTFPPLCLPPSSGQDTEGAIAEPLAPRCPHCGNAVPEAGPERVVCPHCGGSFRVEPVWNFPALYLPPSLGRDTQVGDLPRTLGRFQLLELLGQGSFGAVYRARDVELNRTVAVKVPRAGSFASAADQDRFLREARSAALLAHPNIVPVHEIAHESGMPYIVSEYVEGQTLADLLNARRPGFREAAELLARVAEALDFAHRRNVIHRDINPRNILIDRSGQPHVTDFGLAHRDDGTTVVTLDGHILGTPAYMSPEQAAGELSKVDARSDVYSLGVILYELLTGDRPFRGNLRMLLQQVLQDEPRPPRRLNDRIPRDLETICLKAMAKAPARRYATAGELAADLQHFLKGEPILARPVGQAERLWRWCRRKPLVAGLAAGVTLLVLAVIGVSVWAAISGTQAAEAAKRAAAADRQVREEISAREQDQKRENLIQRLQLVRFQPQKPWGWSEDAWKLLVDERAERNAALQTQAAALLAGLDAPRARAKHWPFPASSVAFDREGRRLLVGGTKEVRPGRVDEPAKLLDGETGQKVHVSEQTGPGPVAFREDGTPVQLVLRDGPSVLLWDLANQRRVKEFRFAPKSDGTQVAMPKPASLDEPVLALSADGELAAASIPEPGGKGVLAVWKSTGERLFQESEYATALAFSAKGDLLATGSADGRIRCWSVPAGRKVEAFSERPLKILGLAFSADGCRLAAGGAGGSLTIWDRNTGLPVAHCRGSFHEVMSVAFSRDGATLASAGRETRLWDAATGHMLLVLSGDYVMGLAFSPDGRKLAASSINAHGLGEVSLWELEEGRGIRTLRGLSAYVEKVCFSPDGRRLAALGHNCQVAIWDLEQGLLELRLDTPAVVFPDNAALAFSADGRRFALASDNDAKLWEIPSGRELKNWPLPPGLQNALGFHPAGKLLLCRMETLDNEPPYGEISWEQHPRVCRIRDLLGRNWTEPLGVIKAFNKQVFLAAAPPDGSFFAVFGSSEGPGGSGRLIKVFDGLTGAERWSVPANTSIHQTGLDPSGRVLAYSTGEEGNFSELVQMPSGPVLETVRSVWALSPGGAHWVEHAASEGGFLLYDRGNPASLVHLGIDSQGNNPMFNRAGNLVAWANPDGSVTVCDLEQIRERLAQVGLGW